MGVFLGEWFDTQSITKYDTDIYISETLDPQQASQFKFFIVVIWYMIEIGRIDIANSCLP